MILIGIIFCSFLVSECLNLNLLRHFFKKPLHISRSTSISAKKNAKNDKFVYSGKYNPVYKSSPNLQCSHPMSRMGTRQMFPSPLLLYSIRQDIHPLWKSVKLVSSNTLPCWRGKHSFRRSPPTPTSMQFHPPRYKLKLEICAWSCRGTIPQRLTSRCRRRR